MRKIGFIAFVLLILLVARTVDMEQIWKTISIPSGSNTAESVPRSTDEVIYKWVDENGVPHFSNMKPVGVTDVQKIKADNYKVDTISLPQKLSQKVSKFFEKIEKRETKKQEVKTSTKYKGNMIFTSNRCLDCGQALAFLRSHRIPFREYNIDRDKSARAKMKSFGGLQVVPLAVLNGKKLLGFEEWEYRIVLNMPRATKKKKLAKKKPVNRTTRKA